MITFTFDLALTEMNTNPILSPAYPSPCVLQLVYQNSDSSAMPRLRQELICSPQSEPLGNNTKNFRILFVGMPYSGSRGYRVIPCDIKIEITWSRINSRAPLPHISALA